MTFDARQSPWNEEEVAEGAMLPRSVVAVGVCANATDASNADAAKATEIYFTDICFLPGIEWSGENPSPQRPFQFALRILVAAPHGDRQEFIHRVEFRGTHQRISRSEAAPIGRNAVVAVQLGLLRTIAPVEILIGAERWRASQLLTIDVELVGFEPGTVGQARPWQRQQIGSHAEEAAETEDGVGHLAGDLVDHQPFDVAYLVAVRPSYRRTFDPVAGNQLMRFFFDVLHHPPPCRLVEGINVSTAPGFQRGARHLPPRTV